MKILESVKHILTIKNKRCFGPSALALHARLRRHAEIASYALTSESVLIVNFSLERTRLW